MTESTKKTVVVGDGWAALGAVGFLAQAGVQVYWIAGTGARVLAPLPTMEQGPGVLVWKELAAKLGVPCGEPETGSYLREFRNKAFREVSWTKAPPLTLVAKFAMKVFGRQKLVLSRLLSLVLK